MAFSSQRDTDLLVPDYHFIRDKGYAETKFTIDDNFVSWTDRRDQLFWRGSLSTQPRLELALALIDRTDIDFRFIKTELNMVEARDSCTEQVRQRVFADSVPFIEFGKYKYVMDVDGYGASWKGLLTKLYLGSCVIKLCSKPIFAQWYYNRLKHKDNVYLVSRVADIKIALDELRADPDLARGIALNGRTLADSLTYFRCMDNVAGDIVDWLANSQHACTLAARNRSKEIELGEIFGLYSEMAQLLDQSSLSNDLFKDHANSLLKRSLSVNEPLFLDDLAIIAKRRGLFDQAISLIDHVVALCPNYTSAKITYASVLIAARRYDEAESVLSKIIEQDFSLDYAYYLFSLLWYKQREIDKALLSIEKALALQQDNCLYKKLFSDIHNLRLTEQARHQAEDQERQLKEARHQAEDQERQLKEARHQAEDQERQLGFLNRENVQMKKKIRSLRSSSSWRLTAPLRRLKLIVRRTMGSRRGQT